MINKFKQHNDYYPPFPFVTAMLAIVMTILTLIWFAIVTLQTVHHLKYKLPALNRAVKVSGLILQLDEVLTMSANMYAITGELKWKKRYQHYDELLDIYFAESTAMIPDISPDALDAVKAASSANIKLIDMEQRSFILTEQGNHKSAALLLDSPEYLHQKSLYLNGMQTYNKAIYDYMTNLLVVYEIRAKYTLLMILVTILMSSVVWYLLYINIRRWKISLETALDEKSRYEKKLEVSNILLEARVHKRTSELNKKNNELTTALENLQITQENLVQSEKMALVGQLSSGIAHEINNPLSFVISNISILKKRLAIITEIIELYKSLTAEINSRQIKSLDESCNTIDKFHNKNKIPDMIADIDNIMAESSEGLTRIKDIVSSLGNFSSTTKVIMNYTDVNSCIESAIQTVLDKLKPGVEIHKNLADLPMTNASYHDLKTAFVNILLNASDAIHEKGIITVESKTSGPNIIITIRDDGCGISPEIINKIFTPFFTTKSIGEATGLGLASSFGIIQSHDGNITVDSKPGEGSTFTIALPVHIPS